MLPTDQGALSTGRRNESPSQPSSQLAPQYQFSSASLSTIEIR